MAIHWPGIALRYNVDVHNTLMPHNSLSIDFQGDSDRRHNKGKQFILGAYDQLI